MTYSVYVTLFFSATFCWTRTWHLLDLI